MKKLLALLMACLMLVSFAACGGNTEEETTAAPEVTTEAPVAGDDVTEEDATEAEEVTEEDVTEAEEETEAEEATEEDETVAEEKTEKPTSGKTEKPTQAASKKPSTTAEVVEYFNTAVNGVKTGAKSVKQQSVVNYLAGKTVIPGGIQGIYKMLGGDDWLDGMLQKNSQGAATYSGADIKAKFPVENESWASKLTASDVKSATCTEANGVYTIKIVTKDDAKTTNVKHGQGYNPKVFSIVLPGVINENIPGPAVSLVGNASMNYPSGTATITVDAATGKVKTAEYDAHWTINFDKMGIVLPFATKSVYTINW